MLHLTEDEKARRFDALQTAFDITKDNYERRRREAELRYEGGDVISAYNKGLADAYACIIADLEKWRV